MANYPDSLPSSTPADHGEVRGEVLAIATDLLSPSRRTTHGIGAYVTGRYYDGSTAASLGGTQSYGNANTYLAPFYCHTPKSFDRVAIAVTTAVAGAIRLGIYASDPDTGWPAAGPLADWGTVDPGTTGVKELTISIALDRRLYWLGFTTTANNVGVRTRPGPNPFNGYSTASVDNNTEGGHYLTSTGGTLNTAGGVPLINNAGVPRVMLRAA